MSAKIIDGKKIAGEIREELKKEIIELKQNNIVPGLATVLVGNDPASETYVRMKKKACEKLGIYTESINRSEDISQQELLLIIEGLKNDPKIHGILVQLPLPDHIDQRKIIYSIPINKDVDGFHPINWGRMLQGEDTFLPCTPAGIHEMLIRSGYSPEKKHVVILGRSNIVGLPLANILSKKKKGANATVTLCHTGTLDLSFYTKQADILIAAMGRPEMITSDMVSEKTVVIDVGVNRVEDTQSPKGYRLVGDVHYSSVEKKVQAISPVPGGVGPMTITMLLKNTVKAAKKFKSASSSIG